MSWAERAILQSILDGDTEGVSGMTIAALRAEALERGMRPAQGTEAGTDETERLGPKGDGPVPQGCAHTPSESPRHDK